MLQHKSALARIRQHLLGKLRGALAGGKNRFDWRAGGRLERKVLQREAGIPENPREQVIEVVRDASGQHAQTLELLRLPHLLGSPLLVGDVARYMRNADEAPGVVADG